MNELNNRLAQSLTVIAVLLTSSLASVSVIVADATLNSVMESMTTHSSSAPASPVDVLAKKASSLSTDAILTEGAASMTTVPLDKKLSTTTADQTVSYTEGEVKRYFTNPPPGEFFRPPQV